MATSGIQAFLEILAAHGVSKIFGNPGTTELPLNDALVGDARFKYILGLQEVPVMAMADGYAMASGELGVVKSRMGSDPLARISHQAAWNLR